MTRRRLLTTGLLAACVAAAALPSFVSAAAPTDPQAAAQQPLQIMRVGDALDLIARPLADVPVMVADTGLDLSNPDIAPRLYRLPAASQVDDPDNGTTHTVPAGAIGWDFVGSPGLPGPTIPDPDPHDPDGGSGHGTAVAGLLGAAWNNGEGGAGVAPNARFLATRTCWDNDECYEHIQAAAINWAADQGVRVASFSWLSGTPIDPDGGLRSDRQPPERPLRDDPVRQRRPRRRRRRQPDAVQPRHRQRAVRVDLGARQRARLRRLRP